MRNRLLVDSIIPVEDLSDELFEEGIGFEGSSNLRQFF